LILIHLPIGRLSEGMHPGIGAQRRSTQSNHRQEVQRSKPEGDAPGWIP